LREFISDRWFGRDLNGKLVDTESGFSAAVQQLRSPQVTYCPYYFLTNRPGKPKHRASSAAAARRTFSTVYCAAHHLSCAHVAHAAAVAEYAETQRDTMTMLLLKAQTYTTEHNDDMTATGANSDRC
jgi:ribonucleotide monophosphatase NagD (HAD superfamily)